MSERATWVVELGLGGSYRDTVLATSGLVGYWPMDEYRNTVADDKSATAVDGAYVNTPTLGVVGPCPEGSSGAYFGATESMDVTDNAAHRPANLSVELWIYPVEADASRTIAIKANASLSNGFGFVYAAANVVAFFVNSIATSVTSSVTLNTWTHFVATYDGTNMRLYKNGALVAGPTAGGGAIVHSTTSLRVGTHAALANSFLGTGAHLALYNVVLSVSTALAHYTAGAWTEVSADVDAATGMSIHRGIQGSSPNDRMAGTGTATFALHNHIGNAGGLKGYYSPLHANCRSGFTFGIPVRISAIYSSVTYPQFRGKLHGISPDTGQYRTQLTHCTAHDVIRDLAVHRVRQVDLQVSQGEDDLLYELLESLPFDARPAGVSIDTGLDTYPYAFDNLGSGRSAQAVKKDVAVSAQGLISVDGSGSLNYVNRQSLALLETVGEINDTALIDLEVSSDLSLVFNRVRITTHPKTVDAAATTVLFSHEGVPSVAPAGGTLELWGDYRNPNDTTMLVGGTAMVTPVSGTDFIANAAADGSGASLTASVTVTATYFASTVKLLLTNNHATSTAHFTTLQCRGKGIYDLSPITVEATSEQPYGDRLFELDLPYQDDANTAQGLADAIEVQYNQLTGQVESFSLNPQRSSGEMAGALTIGYDIGFPLALTESMSGLDSATVMVRSVDILIEKGGWFAVTFGVAPRTGSSLFILDESELDDPDDVLSYA